MGQIQWKAKHDITRRNSELSAGLLKIPTGLCASSRNLFFNFSSSVERQMKWWALSSAEGPLGQWCGGYSVCVINLILANANISRSLKRIPVYRNLHRRGDHWAEVGCGNKCTWWDEQETNLRTSELNWIWGHWILQWKKNTTKRDSGGGYGSVKISSQGRALN